MHGIFFTTPTTPSVTVTPWRTGLGTGRLVIQGHADAQIAGQPYIGVSTVRSRPDRTRDKAAAIAMLI
jgi:hypothetical protein